MKVWMHTIGYPPAQIGGTEVHVQELAEGLVSDGHEVHVSIPRLADVQNAPESKGVALHSVSDDEIPGLFEKHNPDVVHFHPLYLDNTMKVQGGALRFGYAGRLTEQKGVRVLLEAMRQMPDLDIQLEFCAPEFDQTGGLADEIRAIALTDPRFTVKGSVHPDEIVDVMRGWDVAVVPSLWMETGPMVVTEAYHAGIPVLGSRRGGIAELVEDGETGFLFEAGSSEELSALMRRCAESPQMIRAMRGSILKGRETMAMVRDVERVYGVLGNG